MSAPEYFADTITILSAPGRRLAKLFTADGGEVMYDETKMFNAQTVRLVSLVELGEMVAKLLPRRECVVVRGELIGGSLATRIRRLVHSDPKTGDQPTLRDVPRRWLAIDADGLERPANIGPDNLEACADVVLDRLPKPFTMAGCYVQATANHGIKPTIRLRLWFWLDRPLTGAELKRWIGGLDWLDTSVFRAAQAIYTSAPVFQAGRLDPVPNRLMELPGLPWVLCPSEAELAPPPQPPSKPLPEPNAHAGAYAMAALKSAVRRVCEAGEGSRHETCVAESRSLARLVDAGHLSGGDVSRVMVEALVRSGKSKIEGQKIVAWGLAHPSGKAA